MIKNTKIKCEYCHAVIDISKNESCPKCGASFTANEQYKAILKNEEELKKLELENARLSNKEKQQNIAARERARNAINKTNNIAKNTKKTVIIIYAIIFGFIFFGCMSSAILGVIGELADDYRYEEQTIPTEPQIVETPTVVGFNETAELIQYSLICDKIEEYNYQYDKPQSGFHYIAMHLVMTNKTDKNFRVWDSIKCNYIKDGYEMNAETSPMHSSDLGMKIYKKSVPAHSSTEGWVFFEVPIGSDIKLYCGDYITIQMSSTPVVEEKEKIEVRFNEVAETEKYNIVCNKVEEYSSYINPPSGFIYAKINFIIDNNISQTIKISGNTMAHYEKDGRMMELERSSTLNVDSNSLIEGKTIDKGSSKEGVVCFTIPIGEELVITFNDEVVIRIPFENVTRLQ